MDFVSCKITLAGDYRQQVLKTGVSYAEVFVLRRIHGGDDTVQNIRVIRTDDPFNPQQEKAYLQSKYDPAVVDQLYPGLIPEMPRDASGDAYFIETPAEAPAPAQSPTQPGSAARRRRASKAEVAAEAGADSGEGSSFPE